MIKINFLLLKTKFVIKTWTVVIRIPHPSSLNQSIFKILISPCNNKNFLTILQPIFLLPFIQISNIGKTSHFSFLLFWSVILLFITFLIFPILVIVNTLLHSPLCFFLQFLVIHTIHNIFFYRHHNVFFQFFLQSFFFQFLLLFLLLLFCFSFLYLLDILIVLSLKIFVGLGKLVFLNLDQ